MEKSISVFIAIVLLGGSGTISNLCPDNYQIGVQSACIFREYKKYRRINE